MVAKHIEIIEKLSNQSNREPVRNNFLRNESRVEFVRTLPNDDRKSGTILAIIGDKCKRYIVIDTHGLLLAVDVHCANDHDTKEGFGVMFQLHWRFDRMTKIYADGGYRGELPDKIVILLKLCEPSWLSDQPIASCKVAFPTPKCHTHNAGLSIAGHNDHSYSTLY